MSQLKQTNKYLDFSYLVFEANVTETLTGAKLKADSEELQFFKQVNKMEFPDSLPLNFKPGLSYTAVVSGQLYSFSSVLLLITNLYKLKLIEHT